MVKVVVHNYWPPRFLTRDLDAKTLRAKRRKTKDTNGQCFACSKQFGVKQPREVYTSDPQMQWVGPECFRKVKAAGKAGYQPPLGGPRLFETPPVASRDK
jgi:hypothetical protein